MKTDLKLATITVLTVLLAACGGNENDSQKLDKLKQERGKLDKEISALELKIAENDSTGPLKIAVRTAEILPAKFIKSIELQGTIESDRNVLMSSDFGGRVLEIMVKEGQKVSKGALLVRLDNELILKNLQEVRNRMELAKITFEKQQRLKDQNVGTEMDFLRAKNDYDAMKRQEETLLTQASKYTLKAQYDGTVDQIFINEGEMAAPGVPVIRIVDNRLIKIKADVSEAYVSIVKAGQVVKVFLPALNKEFDAKISSVGQVIDPANRTFPLYIFYDNKNNDLKPNLLATVKATEYAKDSAIVIPAKIIKRSRGLSYVLRAVQENGAWVARRMEITEGRTSNASTEVLKGLKQGDIIIIEGYQSLEDGDFLNIIN